MVRDAITELQQRIVISETEPQYGYEGRIWLKPIITTDFTYTVEQISGAQYGFAENASGYWESQNKGVSNSCAICRVRLTVNKATTITFGLINWAESTYDYGLFGALDTALSLNATADSGANSYAGIQSADEVQLEYPNVSPGSHFIDVKFIKDTSVDKENDSLQFRIIQ